MKSRDTMQDYGETAEAATERLAEPAEMLGLHAKMQTIPSFTVYIDVVGRKPTAGDVAEILLRHFDDAVHIEVIPR